MVDSEAVSITDYRGGYLYDGEWSRVDAVRPDGDELELMTTPITPESVPAEKRQKAQKAPDGKTVLLMGERDG